MNRFDPWLTYPAMECSVSGKMLTYGDMRNMAKQFGSFLLDSGKIDCKSIIVIDQHLFDQFYRIVTWR